uniref:Uncharacterized protein n=1 Tax=Eutreptiella gymnastica TaxID=73025 RepID=A0A7S1ICR5_9EUGL
MNHPSFSDAGLTNWVLGAGGRTIRIDWDNPKKRVIKGAEYTARLQRSVLALAHIDVLDGPHGLPKACDCCRACWRHPWDNTPGPLACPACFACMQRWLGGQITAATATPGTMPPAGFEPASETSRNAKCYPYP